MIVSASGVNEKEWIPSVLDSRSAIFGRVLFKARYRTGSFGSTGCSEDAYLSRVTLRTINPETAVMRAATEDCYHQICFTVNYWANRDNLTGTEKATATVCKRFIEVINQLVKEFRQKINSNGDIINDDEDEGLTPDGLTPDPSLESEGSEMLNDSEVMNQSVNN